MAEAGKGWTAEKTRDTRAKNWRTRCAKRGIRNEKRRVTQVMLFGSSWELDGSDVGGNISEK